VQVAETQHICDSVPVLMTTSYRTEYFKSGIEMCYH